MESARFEFRKAIVAAVASGDRVADVAEAAGLTRQRVYQLTATAEAEWSERLAELDGRYERLVDGLAAREKPVPENVKDETAKRNSQARKRRNRGLPPLTTVLADVRSFAESKLLRYLEENPDEPLVRRVVAELDEAYVLRQALSLVAESRAGL